MQHDGWLEAMMQVGLRQDLTFRNLGYSADTLTTRLRSKDFGTPDEWLTRCRADVVFAFFGYNESFAGEAGLPKFEKDLTEFIKKTRGQKYNGETAPTLVLFSPFACEDLRQKTLQDPAAGIAAVNANLRDLTETNQRLANYTDAMRRVAEREKVTFVDLFQPTQDIWAPARWQQFTINGVHLNTLGNSVVGKIICDELFGGFDLTGESGELLQQVRDVVVDKNFHWFSSLSHDGRVFDLWRSRGSEIYGWTNQS